MAVHAGPRAAAVGAGGVCLDGVLIEISYLALQGSCMVSGSWDTLAWAGQPLAGAMGPLWQRCAARSGLAVCRFCCVPVCVARGSGGPVDRGSQVRVRQNAYLGWPSRLARAWAGYGVLMAMAGMVIALRQDSSDVLRVES